MSGRDGRSVWFWVFAGCGTLVFLGIVAAGVALVGVVRFARGVEREMKDPELRAAHAAEALAAETLPAGYHAAMHVRAPLGLGRVVVLSDGELREGTQVTLDGDHAFFFFEGPGWDRDWKRFASGGEPPLHDISKFNVDVGSSRELGRGSVVVGGMVVFYTVRRGDVSGEGFETDDGVFSVLFIRCRDAVAKHSRMGLWAGPPGADVESPLAGTTGDPREIERFLGHFGFCE